MQKNFTGSGVGGGVQRGFVSKQQREKRNVLHSFSQSSCKCYDVFYNHLLWQAEVERERERGEKRGGELFMAKAIETLRL